MKRLTALLLTLVLLGTLLTGCSKQENQAPSAETTKEKTAKESIVYGMWSAPDGLFNPLLANTQYDNYIIAATYNGLLQYDDEMNLIGDLAASYAISEDGLTLTFALKEGIVWHDGTPMTGEDVQFTLETLKNPEYTGARSDIGEMIESVSVDGNTVNVQLAQVNAVALSDIGTIGIIPKHIWSPIPVATWQEATDTLKQCIGTGAFKMDSIEEGQHVKLVANDPFYGGTVKSKQLIFKVANKDTVQVELQNGTIDIAEITDMKKADIDALSVSTTSFANRLFQYMGFNLRDKRFSDVRIRQAFAYALDRPTIGDALTDGKATLLDTPMIPTGWAYPDTSVLNAYAFSTDKAIELLEDAGYTEITADGTRTNKAGESLNFVLTYPSGHTGREKAAVVIQDYLKQIGVQVTLKMLDFSTTMDEVVGNHQFDAYLMGNTLNADPNPKPYWHSTAASDEPGNYAWNISGFRNPEADTLMDQALVTNDKAERKALYEKFAVLMNQELPWIPLYCEDVVMGYNKALEGYAPSTYQVIHNVENWVIYQ